MTKIEERKSKSKEKIKENVKKKEKCQNWRESQSLKEKIVKIKNKCQKIEKEK